MLACQEKVRSLLSGHENALSHSIIYLIKWIRRRPSAPNFYIYIFINYQNVILPLHPYISLILFILKTLIPQFIGLHPMATWQLGRKLLRLVPLHHIPTLRTSAPSVLAHLTRMHPLLLWLCAISRMGAPSYRIPLHWLSPLFIIVSAAWSQTRGSAVHSCCMWGCHRRLSRGKNCRACCSWPSCYHVDWRYAMWLIRHWMRFRLGVLAEHSLAHDKVHYNDEDNDSRTRTSRNYANFCRGETFRVILLLWITIKYWSAICAILCRAASSAVCCVRCSHYRSSQRNNAARDSHYNGRWFTTAHQRRRPLLTRWTSCHCGGSACSIDMIKELLSSYSKAIAWFPV